MQKWRPWETANEVEWRLALERESVIRPLAEEERLTNGRLQEAIWGCKRKPPKIPSAHGLVRHAVTMYMASELGDAGRHLASGRRHAQLRDPVEPAHQMRGKPEHESTGLNQKSLAGSMAPHPPQRPLHVPR